MSTSAGGVVCCTGVQSVVHLTAAVVLSGSAAASTVDQFTASCAGCHAGGGNVVQGGASLRTGDLKRNGAASPEAIYEIIYKGKGKMPGYGKNCAPRGKCTFGPRLSDDDISRLTAYVVEQAERDWK
ncbi:hypothetical protein WJX72_008036 [[Myrmecia] bisecta]|uniref:Cytochrome c-553 n=1 Tax=[Myrmecia] bisecta TaxID=41462 RepID=A0AAW1QSA9_9CHLO